MSNCSSTTPLVCPYSPAVTYSLSTPFITPSPQRVAVSDARRKFNALCTRLDCAVRSFNQSVSAGVATERTARALQETLLKASPLLRIESQEASRLCQTYLAALDEMQTQKRFKVLQVESPSPAWQALSWISEHMQLLPGAMAAPRLSQQAQEYLDEGIELAGLGRNQEAYDALTKSITATSDANHRAHYNRGIIGLRLKRYKNAQDDLERAFELGAAIYNKKAEYFHYLAHAHANLNEIDEAILSFNTAIKLHLEDTQLLHSTYHTLAMLHTQKNTLAEASTSLEKAARFGGEKYVLSPTYLYLRGLIIFATNTDDFEEAETHFAIARVTSETDLDEVLMRWFLNMHRYDLAFTYFEKRGAAVLNPKVYFALSETAFANNSWKDGVRYFLKAAELEKMIVLSDVTSALVEVLRSIHDSHAQMSFPLFRSLLEETARKIEHERDATLVLSALFFYGGKYERAKLLLQQLAAKRPSFTPLSDLVSQILSRENLQETKALYGRTRREISPLLGVRDDLALQLKGLICLTFTFLKMIKEVDRDPVLEFILQAAGEPPSVSSYLFAKVLGTIVALGGVGAFLFRRCKKQVKVTPLAPQMTAPPSPPPPKPKTIQPSTGTPPVIDMRAKPFEEALKKLFAGSLVGIYFLDIFTEGEAFKIILECHANKYWTILNEYRVAYADVTKQIVGTFSSREVPGCHRWVFLCPQEYKVQATDEVINKAKEAIRTLDEKVRHLVANPPPLPLPKWSQALAATFIEQRRHDLWEKTLDELFRAFAIVSIDRDPEVWMQVAIRFKPGLMDYFNTDAGLQLIEECALKISPGASGFHWDYSLDAFIFLVTRDSDPSDTAPNSAPLSEYLLKVTAEPEPSVELKPQVSTGQIHIAHVASQSIFEKRIQEFREVDSQRVKELYRIIQQLEMVSPHPDMLDAKRYLVIRFLEIYRRFTFLGPSPELRAEARTMRNALMHHLMWVSDDELVATVRGIISKKSEYEKPYQIDQTPWVRYALDLDVRFVEELVPPLLDEPGALMKIIEACERFHRVDLPQTLKAATQSGLILTIRELLQRTNISLATKKAIESDMKRRLPTWVFPEFVLGVGLVELNLLSSLGNRLAHGDVGMECLPAELQAVTYGLPTFSEIIRSKL